MGCFPSKEEDLLKAEFLISPKNSSLSNDTYTYLKKGGIVIKTPIGYIQYGMPPETLKDTMAIGYSVPEYYLIPEKKFNWTDGISLIEFEFPVYYNFFLRKQTKTKLICDLKTSENIRTIFQETLLGPKNFNTFEKDFTPDFVGMPDMRKELDYFANNPFSPGKKYEFDEFIEFHILQEKGSVQIERKIEDKILKIVIARNDGDFVIFDANKKEVARITDDVKLNQHSFFVCETLSQEDIDLFEPPIFGLTVLGNSHGFDMCGSTTGFIIWINKKGIMVDPPPYSSKALRDQGIPPNFIEKIIISHCHADHDSGAFHKIIEASPVEILSTRTILNSFLRKYSALSSISIENISKLFQYRLIEVGHPTFILGARFTFNYSFHSIPALCFEIEFEGKKLFFSGDTFYNPPKLLELKEKGIFSQERYEFLSQKDFSKYDLILHEAGVPPIHTPLSVLASLPEEIKKKILLIHIAKKDVTPESNLKNFPIGLKNTVVLVEKSSDQQDTVFQNLNLLCDIELINWVPFNRIFEIIKCFLEIEFKEGEIIINQNTFGKGFYIIKSGIVRVYSESLENSFSKICYRGDYFGESSIIGNGFRLANVQAITDVKLLTVNSSDFKWIFSFQSKGSRNPLGPLELIKNLSEMRQAKAGEFINMNYTISKMTENQKCLINMFIKEQSIAKNTFLWKKGESPDFCFFIKSGKYQIKIPFQKMDKDLSVKIGTLVGDFPFLLANEECESTVKCLEEGVIYKFPLKQLNDYLIQYPGFYIVLKDKYIIF